MKLSTVVLSLIPGVGQIHQGRARRGILHFLFFAIFLNAYLVSPFLLSSRLIRYAFLAIAAIGWLVAFIDACGDGGAPRDQAPAREPERERVYDDR